MIAVFIVPTGLGCEIGGHAGDANPTAKLLASVCDTLITHPNVLNASDLNEMTENTLYVEGSLLDRFLRCEVDLQRVHYNRILLAVNRPVSKEIVNAVSAARLTIGADIRIVELDTLLKMTAEKQSDGRAGGTVEGWKELVSQISDIEFDALAIASAVEMEKKWAYDYIENGGVNPWGGIEAKLSKLVSLAINKPVAHAPFGSPIDKSYNEIVDPRMAAEMLSWCFLHCVFKGLHRAPRIGDGISRGDVSVLVSPVNCFGDAHIACLKAGIPIITVRENMPLVRNEMDPYGEIEVNNYWEAAGYISCMKAGVVPRSVRRPIGKTEIINVSSLAGKD